MKWFRVTDTRYNVYDYLQAVDADNATNRFVGEGNEPMFDEDVTAVEVDESQVPYSYKKDAQ